MPTSAPTITPFRPRGGAVEPFAHPSWQRAHDEALAAIGRGDSIALLGRPGTGKTFLLKHLADRLRRDGLDVAVRRLPAEGDDDAPDVMLVDEADSLSAGELDRLCAGGAIVVLAGLPTFATVVATLPRPIATIVLEPLSAENVARFMAMRLRELGRPTTTFTPEAVLSLTAHSAGLMRLVVTLSGSAMFLAGQEDAPQVTARHVDEANALRFEADDEAAIPAPAAPARDETSPPRPPSRQRRLRPVLVGAAAAVIAGIGLWASLQVGPRPQSPVRSGTVAMTPPVAEPPPMVAAAEPLPAPAVVIPPPAMPAAPGRKPAAVPTVERAMAYTGPVTNVTMGQGGLLSLVVQRHEGRAVTVEFHASSGLIGTGQLIGTMSGDGRIAVDGRLMMGRNPFDCVLSAVATGDNLVGEASFTRVGASSSARSTFTLARRS